MKKIFTIVISIIMLMPIKASAIEVYERNSSNNYGVNKDIIITEKNKKNILNTKYVDANDKIYDFAEIIDSDTEAELKKEIAKFINITNMDMVILTIDMNYINDEENETYAADFYDYNDFGINFEHYSGVLILRNINASNPYYDIYTFGLAQLYFSYDRLNDTLDKIYNDFTSHDYKNGFSTFINDMSTYYNEGIPNSNKNYYVDNKGFLRKKYTPPIILALIVSLLGTCLIIYILVKKNKMVKIMNDANTYLDNNSVKYTVNTDKFINTYTTSIVIASSTSSSSHTSSSSGSSGMGHSSGGGRHG